MPATSTHGAKAPRNAPSKHSKQAANHAALAAALVYARRLTEQGYHITITLTGGNTHRDLTAHLNQETDPNRPGQPEEATPHPSINKLTNRKSIATYRASRTKS